MVTIRFASAADAESAHEFHRRELDRDRYILLRDVDELKHFAGKNALLLALDLRGQIVGTAYFAEGHDASGKFAWEVGGVIVAPEHRKAGMASRLINVTLCVLIDIENPLGRGAPIICHVHAENKKPLQLIQNSLGFIQSEAILDYPASWNTRIAPDAGGRIRAKEFHFDTEETSKILLKWCDNIGENPTWLDTGAHHVPTNWAETLKHYLAQA